MIGRVVMLAVLAGGPAFGQSAPPTLPTRDVSVVYRLAGAAREALPGGLPETVKLFWAAGPQQLRVEPEGRGQVLLVDLATKRATLVESGLHGVIDLPVRPSDLDPMALRDAKLTRKGSARIAGLGCTDYDVQSRRGHGTVCLTPDGLALRAAGEVDGKRGSLVAVSVSGGPFTASLFQPPPGYMRLAIPSLNKLR